MEVGLIASLRLRKGSVDLGAGGESPSTSIMHALGPCLRRVMGQ
jgi:hypothetical protein